MMTITTENFILLVGALLTLGAYMIYRHGQKTYDRGITDAVLMHRQGRLKYKDCLDDRGVKMVNIEIEPIDDED